MIRSGERKRIFESLAVALKYAPVEGDTAPRIIAKGKGYVADRLKELARENDIPIHDDPELARLLSAVEVESEIPVAMFAAVAEVLALIYKTDEAKRKAALGE
jgi:flagellar biosynthesis protein